VNNDDWELEALARYGAYLVLMLLALGLGWLLRKFTWSRTVANLPEPAERAEQLACVRALRKGGASLDECVAELRRRGVHKGVARSMVLDMEREQPADVDHPRETSWRGWSLRYPGNWRREPVVPELGEDIGISIDAVGGGMLMLLDLEGEGGELEQMISDQESQIQLPTRTPVTCWGWLSGQGTRFRGTHAKLRLPVDLLVFRPSETERPFALLEWHVTEEAHLIEPGFALIRESFTADRKNKRPLPAAPRAT
jgi:hypothetical protein